MARTSLKRQIENLADYVTDLDLRLQGAERVIVSLLAEQESKPAPAKKTASKPTA